MSDGGQGCSGREVTSRSYYEGVINATPYIGFTGQAEEALQFYHSVFGGELNVLPWKNVNPNTAGIMHGQLTTTAGWHLMAADSPQGEQPAEQQRVTICVWGDDVESMTSQFAALSAGGTVHMPLEKQMWGAVFGGLKDKFGVDWSFNIGGDSENQQQ